MITSWRSKPTPWTQRDREGDVQRDLAAIKHRPTAYAYGERAERALHHLIHFAESHGFLHAS